MQGGQAAGRRRDLGQHAPEGEELEVPEGNADDKLMERGRNEENQERRRRLAPTSVRQRQVDMRHHPRVHGEVPGAPEVAQCGRVPPVPVELPVSKPARPAPL